MQLPEISAQVTANKKRFVAFDCTFLFPVMVLFWSYVLRHWGKKTKPNKPKQTMKDAGEKTKALPRLQIFEAAPQCTESSRQHPIVCDVDLLLYPES